MNGDGGKLLRNSLERWRLGFFLLSAVILVAMGCGVFDSGASPFARIATYGGYFFVGILGATIANSTGAVGGIVFLPFFTSMGFSLNQSLGTSFTIQCFGMTAGAMAWLIYQKREAPKDAVSSDFRRAFLVSAAGSVVGLRAAQEWLPSPQIDIKVLFSVFSIAVGLLILQRTLSSCPKMEKRSWALNGVELWGLGLVGLVGGGRGWTGGGVFDWAAIPGELCGGSGGVCVFGDGAHGSAALLWDGIDYDGGGGFCGTGGLDRGNVGETARGVSGDEAVEGWDGFVDHCEFGDLFAGLIAGTVFEVD
jgi:hypothetical protein